MIFLVYDVKKFITLYVCIILTNFIKFYSMNLCEIFTKTASCAESSGKTQGKLAKEPDVFFVALNVYSKLDKITLLKCQKLNLLIKLRL
jgi:hypothetical protein